MPAATARAWLSWVGQCQSSKSPRARRSARPGRGRSLPLPSSAFWWCSMPGESGASGSSGTPARSVAYAGGAWQPNSATNRGTLVAVVGVVALVPHVPDVRACRAPGRSGGGRQRPGVGAARPVRPGRVELGDDRAAAVEVVARAPGAPGQPLLPAPVARSPRCSRCCRSTAPGSGAASAGRRSRAPRPRPRRAAAPPPGRRRRRTGSPARPAARARRKVVEVVALVDARRPRPAAG